MGNDGDDEMDASLLKWLNALRSRFGGNRGYGHYSGLLSKAGIPVSRQAVRKRFTGRTRFKFSEVRALLEVWGVDLVAVDAETGLPLDDELQPPRANPETAEAGHRRIRWASKRERICRKIRRVIEAEL